MEEKLLQVLETIIGLNQELLDTFRKERENLLKNNIAGLKQINSKEMSLGSDLREYEKQRIDLTNEFRKVYKIEKEHIHIEDIIQAVPETFKGPFRQKAKSLKEILDEIMKTRNINNRIIERMLKFNEKNIKLFMTLGRKNLTYDNKGKMKQSDKRVLNSLV